MARYGNPYVTPPVVLNLLIINGLFFLGEIVLPGRASDALIDALGLHFFMSKSFGIWQFVTHMFLHGGMMHLFTNMFALWMFGRTIEYDLGSRRFLAYYLICGIGAALIQTGVNWIEIASLSQTIQETGATSESIARLSGMVNGVTIGASGAVFGVLLAFGLMHPNVPIYLFFIPIPIKAKWFVIGYGLLELSLGVSGSASNIAHFAHVGGLLWGLLLLTVWKRQGKIHY